LGYAGQNRNLRDFLDKGEGNISNSMPDVLDKLLDGNMNWTVIENQIQLPSGGFWRRCITGQQESLKKHDAEFLMLGLAYHISRQQDSVRLKKKFMTA
jgi:hypothetical protein